MELSDNGQISSCNEFELSVADGDDEGNFVVRDEIIANYRGEMLRIRVLNFTADLTKTCKPTFAAGSVFFSESNYYTTFAYAGDNFCWTAPNKVFVCDLGMIDSEVKVIYLYPHIDKMTDWQAEWIVISSCDPKKLL